MAVLLGALVALSLYFGLIFGGVWLVCYGAGFALTNWQMAAIAGGIIILSSLVRGSRD